MAPRDARTPAGAIDLRRAAPAAPVGAFRAAVADATAAITPQLTSAGWSQGLPELRAGIAERHTRRGVPTAPEEVLVTGGALPGLWLVLAGLLGGAPRVLVETPTYPSALDALRERRARVWGWPVVDGWDPAQFEQLVRQHGIGAAYLMADFHNPTGRLMDAGTRAELLAVAERHGVTLIVDETMAELDLRPGAPEPPPPLADPHVITLGSLSKAVWDGLRVGWIRAGRDAIERLALHPLAAQLDTPPLEQAIGAALLPELDALVRARREILGARLRAPPRGARAARGHPRRPPSGRRPDVVGDARARLLGAARGSGRRGGRPDRSRRPLRRRRRARPQPAAALQPARRRSSTRRSSGSRRCSELVAALEHDDRDLALGPALVGVVVGPVGDHLGHSSGRSSAVAVRARARKRSAKTCTSTSGSCLRLTYQPGGWSEPPREATTR